MRPLLSLLKVELQEEKGVSMIEAVYKRVREAFNNLQYGDFAMSGVEAISGQKGRHAVRHW